MKTNHVVVIADLDWAEPALRHSNTYGRNFSGREVTDLTYGLVSTRGD